MGQQKSISIGGGEKIVCDYEGLKQKLAQRGQVQELSERILRDNFPLEFKQDCEREEARKRWDSWFAVENQTESRIAAWGHRTVDSPPYAFQHGNHIVINQAKRAMYAKRVSGRRVDMLASLPLNNVSTFTGWLFRLQHQSNASSQSAGIEGERLVRKAKLEYPKPRYAGAEWQPRS